MTAEGAERVEPVYVTDVFGACPDCGGGACYMNCDPASITFREIIASCVIQIETDEKNGRKTRDSFLTMLTRIHPILKSGAKTQLEARLLRIAEEPTQ